jgi:TRAP-type C4-dicarboxylate transport system permease small subunit
MSAHSQNVDAPPPSGGGGFLGTLHRLLAPPEDLLNILAAITIFVVMLATTGQIFTRILGYPVPGFLEASEQAIAVFAFLGTAYAQRLGAHIRMEMLIGSMRGRMRWITEAIGTFISMLMIAVLVRYSWDFFYDAWTVGDTTFDYKIPTWPSKLLVPFAFSFWFLRLFVELIGYLRLVVHPNAEPIAVPIIKSAAELAKEEAAEAFGRDAGVGFDSEKEADR